MTLPPVCLELTLEARRTLKRSVRKEYDRLLTECCNTDLPEYIMEAVRQEKNRAEEILRALGEKP